MRKTLFGFAGMGFLLGALIFAVAPVRAQSVDDKIQNLEQELSQLKSQQIEMKKDAAAAAAALPSFSYRPGSGVTIAAADKSWSLNFSYEFHVHMYNHIDGAAHAGLSTGDLFFRRNRPYITYCWADCFYELLFGLDMDTTDIADEQNTVLSFHLEQMNPYQAPGADVSAIPADGYDQSGPFSPRGRFGRLSYLTIGFWILGAIGMVAAIVIPLFAR